MKIPRPSLALLVIQLALVSVAATRHFFPRRVDHAWTRAHLTGSQWTATGRNLSLQLEVNGCISTLPSARQAQFPRDYNGAVKPGPYTIQSQPPVEFPARLKAENNGQLYAIRIEDAEKQQDGQMVVAWPGKICNQMTLLAPVTYSVSKQAPDLAQLKPNDELHVEVHVPRHGPPQPVGLYIVQDGYWNQVK